MSVMKLTMKMIMTMMIMPFQALLEVVHDLFEEQTSVENVVLKIMQRAQTLLRCERCSVLLRDSTSDVSRLVDRDRGKDRGDGEGEGGRDIVGGGGGAEKWRGGGGINGRSARKRDKTTGVESDDDKDESVCVVRERMCLCLCVCVRVSVCVCVCWRKREWKMCVHACVRDNNEHTSPHPYIPLYVKPQLTNNRHQSRSDQLCVSLSDLLQPSVRPVLPCEVCV